MTVGIGIVKVRVTRERTLDTRTGHNYPNQNKADRDKSCLPTGEDMGTWSLAAWLSDRPMLAMLGVLGQRWELQCPQGAFRKEVPKPHWLQVCLFIWSLWCQRPEKASVSTEAPKGRSRSLGSISGCPGLG